MSTSDKSLNYYRTPVWFRNPDDEDAEDLPDDYNHIRRRMDWHTYHATAPLSSRETIACMAVEGLAESDVSDWIDFDGVVIVTVGPTTVHEGRFPELPTSPPKDGRFGELAEFVVEVEVEINARAKPYKRPEKPEPRDPLLPEAIPHDPRQSKLAFDETAP